MQFTIFSILSLAFAGAAVATAGEESMPSGGSVTACGDGNTIACCNTEAGGKSSILPIAATLCSIPVLNVVAQAPCDGDAAFCCPTNQDGTINIGAICVPVSA